MWIGKWKYKEKELNDLKWKLYPENKVKIIGVYFSGTCPASKIPENWEGRVKKCEKIMWK